MNICIFPKHLQLPGIKLATLWLESHRTNHSAYLLYHLFSLITPYLYCAATSSVPEKMRNVFVIETKNIFFEFVPNPFGTTTLYDTCVTKLHVVKQKRYKCYGLHFISKIAMGGERTGASFTTGRPRIPDLVLTSAERATASLPKWSLTTRSRG